VAETDDTTSKSDKEREFAQKMLLNEHTRWNQWSLFFLGGLIAIVAFIDKMPGLFGHKTMLAILLCMGLFWIGSAFSIKRSTGAWIDVIKGLEAVRSGKAWDLFEKAKTDNWSL
jgi:hypothetical protein